MGEEGGRAGARGLWDPTGEGTSSGHHLCPLVLPWVWSSAALETQEPTSPWKNFTEQEWGGKPNDFLLPHDSKLSVSTGATGRIGTVGPAQRRRAAAETAPGWGGDPGPASKFRGRQGQAPAAPGTRACGQAVPTALTSRSPRCGCLLVPGSTGHLQPRSVFWEGVRMQAGDAQAQGLRQPHTSPLALSQCLQPVLPGVTAQEFAESLSGGSRGRQCHPGLAPARCSGYRRRAAGGAGVVQTLPGRGWGRLQPNQTTQKSAGTADPPPDQG